MLLHKEKKKYLDLKFFLKDIFCTKYCYVLKKYFFHIKILYIFQVEYFMLHTQKHWALNQKGISDPVVASQIVPFNMQHPK